MKTRVELRRTLSVAVICLICLGFTGFCAHPALAADTYWDHGPATPGDWFDPANWTNGVPVADARAYVDNCGTAKIASGLAAAEELRLGNLAEGHVIHSGGTLCVEADSDGSMILGYDVGSLGTYTMSGSADFRFDNLGIGQYGTGYFVQNGGSAYGGYALALGGTSSGSGTYELNAGALRVQVGLLGVRGDALFMQQPGTTFTISNRLHLGEYAGSFGRYEMYGGQIAREVGAAGGFLETHGWEGTSEFVQYDGIHGLSGVTGISLGYYGQATYELHGGTLNETSLEGAKYGRAYFLQTGGDHTVANELSLGGWHGYDPDCNGVYELTGGTLSAGIEELGNNATGRFIQSGGQNNISQALRLGTYSYGVGTYDLSGGELSAEEEYVGMAGMGEFDQTGGANRAGFLSIGSSGAYRMSGGVLELRYGLAPAGELNLDDSNGSVHIGGIADLSSASIANPGGLTITGGDDSLIVFAASFDPNWLKDFASTGLVYFGNGPVTIPAGRRVVGWAPLNNHVICQGDLLAVENGAIDLRGGINVQGGTADLRAGSLTVDDEQSGISSGNLTANNATVGQAAAGRFTQTGGACIITNMLNLGHEAGADGTYELSGGTLTIQGVEHLGYHGTGRLVQTGGQHTVGSLLVADRPGSCGSIELAGGSIHAYYMNLGGEGEGTVVQSGGRLEVTDAPLGWGVFRIGGGPGGVGRYELSDGCVVAGHILVGGNGNGQFIQTGGEVQVDYYAIEVAYGYGSEGRYELHDGKVHAQAERVGHYGDGTFVQYGGTNRVSDFLEMGYTGGSGRYELHGGQLHAAREIVGRSTDGEFVHTGGVNTVSGDLVIGRYSSGSGLYVISGGVLRTGGLLIGANDETYAPGPGTFEIADSGAKVCISDRLRFGPRSTLQAAPGSTINMTGANLLNESTNPEALAGLSNLRMVFEGGPDDVGSFEAAGQDLGAAIEGFEANFALGVLKLKNGREPGCLQLVDLSDNQPGWEGSEALYVGHLFVGRNSYLDLNGLNLYYLDATIHRRAEIIGGTPIAVPFEGAWPAELLSLSLVDSGLGAGGAQPIPEPTGLCLLALGGLLPLLRRAKTAGHAPLPLASLRRGLSAGLDPVDLAQRISRPGRVGREPLRLHVQDVLGVDRDVPRLGVGRCEDVDADPEKGFVQLLEEQSAAVDVPDGGVGVNGAARVHARSAADH